MRRTGRFPTLWPIAAALLLSACTASPPEPDATPERLVLTPVGYEKLPGWRADALDRVDAALARSCARLDPQPDARPLGGPAEAGTVGDWKRVCRHLAGAEGPDALRRRIEGVLQPYRVEVSGGGDRGLFTGYYEPELNGSLERSDRYSTPLRKRPADLVSVSLGEFRDSLDGERIAGRLVGNRLRPYETRAEIVAGALEDRTDPLVWVDDAVDAFFLQIQGSGRVRLQDGRVMRVGYDGTNGHVYFAVGRALVQRGAMTVEEVSLQSIRAWARAHPDQVPALLNLNPSYVFFREIAGEGPIGAQGAPLTPRRSLAVDRRHVPLGALVWLDVDHPPSPGGSLRRLMVAQDVGGAIRGPIRGDVFWGHGPEAERLAGTMRAQGTYYLLLPRQATPVANDPAAARADGAG